MAKDKPSTHMDCFDIFFKGLYIMLFFVFCYATVMFTYDWVIQEGKQDNWAENDFCHKKNFSYRTDTRNKDIMKIECDNSAIFTVMKFQKCSEANKWGECTENMPYYCDAVPMGSNGWYSDGCQDVYKVEHVEDEITIFRG